ncbi:MAG: ribonuclease P protein component [Deltaproteobacteria bacterium]|nr:ribonuclease P protein component [Deltaproteobacteria bacterium]
MSPRSSTNGVSAEPPGRGAKSRARKHGLPKDERLLLSGDYRRASARGARRTSPHFIVYLAHNQLGRRRLGITASRKVGNAVVRNRIKRLLREYFRTAKDRLPPSRDFVIIAKRALGPMTQREVSREMDRALGALRGDPRDDDR